MSSAGPKAPILLLTCMDYRYPEMIVRYMNTFYKDQKYDQAILAGASLGANLVAGKPLLPHWRCTFFEHVLIAGRLHGIEKIILLDHLGCGAYESFRKVSPGDPNEREAHEREIRILYEAIKAEPRFRGLAVLSGILPNAKTGKVIPVALG